MHYNPIKQNPPFYTKSYPYKTPLRAMAALPEFQLFVRRFHSRHQVTPAVTRASNTTRPIRERSASDSVHLAEIATDSTLSELRRLGLYIKAFLPDVAHQAHQAESAV